MFVFKQEDLQAQQDSSYAYTAAPTHSLASISASTMRFLDHATGQTESPAQPSSSATLNPLPYANTPEHNAILSGLCLELNTYLGEPRMDHLKITDGGPQWCDPLLYWAVSAVHHFYEHF